MFDLDELLDDLTDVGTAVLQVGVNGALAYVAIHDVLDLTTAIETINNLTEEDYD